jgi:hypothetical protein
MSIPNKGDVLIVPAYSAESERDALEISWSQSFRTRTARYYLVNARNQSQGNTNVLMYIQDRHYKDYNSNEFIGKLPGARQDGSKYSAISCCIFTESLIRHLDRHYHRSFPVWAEEQNWRRSLGRSPR